MRLLALSVCPPYPPKPGFGSEHKGLPFPRVAAPLLKGTSVDPVGHLAPLSGEVPPSVRQRRRRSSCLLFAFFCFSAAVFGLGR
jgi:hypothetical protein